MARGRDAGRERGEGEIDLFGLSTFFCVPFLIFVWTPYILFADLLGLSTFSFCLFVICYLTYIFLFAL